MQAREWNEIDSGLPHVRVELAGESERSSRAAHGHRHKVIEVAEGRGGQLKGAEADIVKSLVVKDDALVSILDQLVHGEGGVVGLKNDI